MTISPPLAQTQLQKRVTANNFIAYQSAKLSVSGTSSSVTFTNLAGGAPVTMKITNTGTAGAYLSGSSSVTGIIPAVASSATPSPASGTNVVSNADYIAAGAILTQDYIAGTDTLAAISSSTTTLEISIGFGQ